MVKSNKSKIHGIQALRFIAAAMVLLTHVSDQLKQYDVHWKHGPIGGAGVDVFFVISGYIMAMIIYSSHQNGGGLIDFLRRRVIRIVPTYWIATTAVILAWHF